MSQKAAYGSVVVDLVVVIDGDGDGDRDGDRDERNPVRRRQLSLQKLAVYRCAIEFVAVTFRWHVKSPTDTGNFVTSCHADKAVPLSVAVAVAVAVNDQVCRSRTSSWIISRGCACRAKVSAG